jgi:REP element-mobilizing transposase RayT
MYREFKEDHTPLAYLITFRCYGTWLHGDERGSIDRHRNRYGSPLIPGVKTWRLHNARMLKGAPVRLNKRQRALVSASIRTTCEIRKWSLYTLNVRTNHCHVVVFGNLRPGRILNALKANATRALREVKLWHRNDSPWSDGGSKRYLWTERHLKAAIDYVELGQGDAFPSLDDIGI